VRVLNIASMIIKISFNFPSRRQMSAPTMTKQKKRILIPIIITAAILIYCWTIILTTETLATWRHYLGIILFIPIAFLIFKNNLVVVTLLTGVYLLLATFNLMAITPGISTSWITIGPISTPPIQLISLGIFVLYFFLNMNSLIDIHLDYKEVKQRNNTSEQNK
jgi:hypothetical protein